jgi:hypothetical protein
MVINAWALLSELPCANGSYDVIRGYFPFIPLPRALTSVQGNWVGCVGPNRFLLSQSHLETQMVSKGALGTVVWKSI